MIKFSPYGESRIYNYGYEARTTGHFATGLKKGRHAGRQHPGRAGRAAAKRRSFESIIG